MKYITVNGMRYGVIKGTLLKDALIKNNLMKKESFVCNGKGLCGRCSVGILREHDKDYIGVKSCQTIVDTDMVVKLNKPNIIYKHIDEDTRYSASLGLAVDIGTTTLSIVLIDLISGKEKGRLIRDNPQYIFGADVVSRIDAYTKGENLTTLIHSAIDEFIGDLKIFKMVISANTVMQHIFANASLKGMRVFPLEADIKYNDIIKDWKKTSKDLKHFHNVDNIIIMPYIGPYFGADALLGVIEADNNNDNPSLLIDLGTNSEIALILDDKIYCTAAAAGCALLGAYNGSDIVNAVSNMLKEQLIDRTGRIIDGKSNVTYKDITLTQADIRSYQLMKAAISTGVKILLKISGQSIDKIKNIYVSGQFGERVKPQDLINGGIIEDCDAIINILGNTSIKGSVKYLNGKLKSNEIEKYINKCKYYNMAEDKDFNDIFVDEINF